MAAPTLHVRSAAESLCTGFLTAFNRRDVEGLIAISHPDIEWHPTALVGHRRVYHGHDGLRQWIADLAAVGARHRGRERSVQTADDGRVVLLSEVLLDGEVMAPSALIATIADGKIIEGHAYLTDEDLLGRLGLMPTGKALRAP